MQTRNFFEYKRVRVDVGDPQLPQKLGVVTEVVIPAASATAESDNGCLALTPLTSAVQTITDVTSPLAARNVKVKASSAITTKVKINGIRGGKSISEEITMTGTTSKAGNLAFDKITSVELPIQTTTPAKQAGTVSVTAATTAGTATLTFVSAITGTAFTIDCELAADDVASTTAAAARIVEVLNENAAFAAAWVASSEAAVITMEALVAAAQDNTLSLTVSAAGDTGLTLGAIAPSGGRAGVAPDKVQVGFGKKFGIPVLLKHASYVLVKLFNGSADSGTVTADATDIEKNVIALNGTPDGQKAIELVIVHF